MPKPGSDEITTNQHRRMFIQFGGPGPNNAVKYAGQDAQYMMLEGVTKPILGGLESIRVPDPNQLKKFRVVGRKASAPDLPTGTLHMLEKHGVLPFQLGEINCPFNVYIPVGSCKDLSDFLNGWTDFVEIYSLADATSVDMGARTAWEDDNQAEDSLALTLDKIYAIGALSFGEKAATQVDLEVVDVVYGSTVECGDCGPGDDGTKKAYAIVKSSGAGSPGFPTELIYTVDGGASWSQVNIAGMGASEDPVAVDIVGNKIVVIGSGAYYWATINSKTGVPGAFTKVTTGFVAAKNPNDLFVLSPREVFFVGDGGYIYKSTDIAAGVTVVGAGSATTNNLLRIHGNGGEILATVGASDTVLISVDRGDTFAAPADSSPSGLALSIGAVAVKSKFEIWLGTLLSGRVYFTLDGGETWQLKSLSGSGTGNIRDIVFATDEVGYILWDDGATAYIHTTWDGGANWARNDSGSPRFVSWPVFDRGNRLAVPDAGPSINSNNLIIGGLAGNGSDGILLIGSAGVL